MHDFAELLKHLRPSGKRWLVRLSLILALGFLAAPSAFAQSPYMPGWGATGLAGRAPEVTIDTEALDALGASQTIAGVAMAQAVAPRPAIVAERQTDRSPVEHARIGNVERSKVRRVAHARHHHRHLADHQRARHLAARHTDTHRVAASPAKPHAPTSTAMAHNMAATAPTPRAAAPRPEAKPIAAPKPAPAAPATHARAVAVETPVVPAISTPQPAVIVTKTSPSVAAAPTTDAHDLATRDITAPAARDTNARAGVTTVAALAAPAISRSVPQTASDATPTPADPPAKASFTGKMAPSQPTVVSPVSASSAAPAARPAVSVSAPAPIQVAAVMPSQPAPSSAMVPVVAPATAAAGAVIRFPSGASDLAADAHGSLDALAQRLAASQDSRVQLVAYASGNDEDANLARRLSLARAIAVRKYLIDQGVRGTRIDVRALGNRNAGNGPADRVDLVVLDR